MGSGLPSASTILTAVRGISLPASRESLVQQAKSNQSDDVIVAVLEHVPEAQYGSASDIAKGVGKANTTLKERIPRISASGIVSTLKGISFPASKADLVAKAKENGADANTVGLIEHMPDQTYNNAIDVSKGIHQFVKDIPGRLREFLASDTPASIKAAEHAEGLKRSKAR